MSQKKEYFNDLLEMINTDHPIVYLHHFDYPMLEKGLREAFTYLNGQDEPRFTEYDNALGIVDFNTKTPLTEGLSLESFLTDCLNESYEAASYLLLKDVHNAMNDPKIVSLLRRIAEKSMNDTIEDYNVMVFILSPVLTVPPELEHYITVSDMPRPDEDEIRGLIGEYEEVYENKWDDARKNKMIIALKGLDEFPIRQILSLLFSHQGEDEIRRVLDEKAQIIKKSGMLELINFEEKAEDIGGLETLKEWLGKKEKVFKQLDKALRANVDIPKGVMIIGMPGCGKSMTAKATAGMFELPLVRLDVGRLLGKYVGESEDNMRRALQLSEAISPCVLWIDEIEKAFAGIGGSGGSDVTTRLFGQFLTWMQEKKNTVFVVATANDITQIPPEFLRKGRFDELFFVELPNKEERRQILEIHLKKRKMLNGGIDLNKLAEVTDGCNGADLEAIVKNAIETAFITDQKTLTTKALLAEVSETRSISEALPEKIKAIRETAKSMQIRPAGK